MTNKQPTINIPSIETLKSMAYDRVVVINQAQQELNALNAEINKMQTTAPIKEDEDDKKE